MSPVCAGPPSNYHRKQKIPSPASSAPVSQMGRKVNQRSVRDVLAKQLCKDNQQRWLHMAQKTEQGEIQMASRQLWAASAGVLIGPSRGISRYSAGRSANTVDGMGFEITTNQQAIGSLCSISNHRLPMQSVCWIARWGPTRVVCAFTPTSTRVKLSFLVTDRPSRAGSPAVQTL